LLVDGLLPNWLAQQNHGTRGLKTEGDNSARQIFNLVSFVCFCDVEFRPQITIRKDHEGHKDRRNDRPTDLEEDDYTHALPDLVYDSVELVLNKRMIQLPLWPL